MKQKKDLQWLKEHRKELEPSLSKFMKKYFEVPIVKPPKHVVITGVVLDKKK